MSVSVELPCGCKINKAFVLSMCWQHVHEINAKQREADEAYRQYENLMRGTTNGK